MNSEHIIKEPSRNARAESALRHLDVHTSALSSFEFVLACFSVQRSERATSAHAAAATHQHSCDKEFVPGNSLDFTWELVQVEVSAKPRQGSIKTLSTCETGIRGWLKIKTVKFLDSSTLLLKPLYLSYSKVVFNVWVTSGLGVISCETWKATKRKGHHQKAYIFFSRDSRFKKKKKGVC